MAAACGPGADVFQRMQEAACIGVTLGVERGSNGYAGQRGECMGRGKRGSTGLQPVGGMGGVRRLGRLPRLDPLTPETLAQAFAAGFDTAQFGA